MLFTDVAFLFYFLPFALVVHRLALVGNGSGRYGWLPQIALFLLTLLFYGFHASWWLYPFCVSISFDLFWAHLLSRIENPRARKVILICSVVQNLSLLGLFKYWELLYEMVEFYHPPMAELLLRLEVNKLPAALPPGISFYTFESLSFVIDVSRREVKPPRRASEFFAFIGMFPRFVAGPIVRYKDMAGQFASYQGMRLAEGLAVFSKGLFLKCCLADSFAFLVRGAFDVTGDIHFTMGWVGLFAYAMQLYLDFAGYSLMAIGLGLCFGFRFPDNFNAPYLSTSLQEFWRRWHITLSTWLRDYLYIPLGGNKKGVSRTYVNIVYTMVLGGLWHGAGVTMALWGFWHGVWLCIERATGAERLPRALHRGLTFFVVLLGWVWFRASSMPEAFKIFSALFSKPSFTPWLWSYLSSNPISSIFCGIGILYCFWWEAPGKKWTMEKLWVRDIATITAFVSAVLMAFSRFKIPFLYYKF